ncbi:MAG: transposase [Gammaproteobacteria bacterium]|nr:transposase [Gammaproteobacteria bacterium]
MASRNRNVGPKSGPSRAALTITHPNAAGIDIGSASHFVAVPPDRDDEPVREFPSFTVDLHALADWLKACGVDTVAMESTGVYWIPVFELLESRGFTVLLVNARHVKNVSGRKSDVLDCQWLQQLMTYGLLRGAFRPADAVCALRALWRQRGMLLKISGPTGATHAKGPHADECSVSQRDLRCRGGDGPEDPARHRRRGTRWSSAGFDERRAHPGQRGRDRQEPAGELAP